MDTGTDTQTTGPVLDIEQGDHEKFAHYALKADITRAYVEGTPVVALCGKVWVPNRDPKLFPVCGQCKELLDMGPQGRSEFFARRVD